MGATAEQLEIRELARDFAEREIRPHAAAWDQRGEVDASLFAKLSELGFLGMLVPESYGGLDLDLVTFVMVVEALSWGDAAVGLAVVVQNGPLVHGLVRHGSDAQQSAWLPRLATGEVVVGFGFSDLGDGSDGGSVAVTSTAEGSGWRLRGSQNWVSNGDRAGALVVLARGPSGAADLSTFIVPRETPGYGVAARETTMGMRALETVRVELDVRVEEEALLGVSGGGLACALEALDVTRLGIAAQALGIAESACEHAVLYALGREQFGRPIAEFGAIQEKIAGMVARIAAGRALLTEVASEAERWRRGEVEDADLTSRIAMAKWQASETAMWVSDEAVQIFGGYGYMREYPVEKLMRDAKGTEIYEGTTEILRSLIARRRLAMAGTVSKS